MGRNRIAVFCIIIISLMLGLMFLSACTPVGVVGTTNPVTDYRKGKDGIVVAFSEGTPPAKVYEQTGFDIVVKVWNKGAYDNPLGRIYISGYDPLAMTLNPATQDLPPIQGSSQYVPAGGYDTVSFRADNVNVLAGDVYKPTLMLSSCFYYKTIATPSVCIVPNPTELVKNKLCEPKSVTMANQGGPIAVTRVDEEIMQGVNNFVITIQNVGGGNVVIPESFNKCPNQLEYKDIDEVAVEAKIRSIGAGDCTPKGRVKLVDGQGVIFCKFDTSQARSGYDPGSGSYMTPLEITLNYAYNTNVKKEIQIVRIPGTKPYS
jgi:hypothetical protein